MPTVDVRTCEAVDALHYFRNAGLALPGETVAVPPVDKQFKNVNLNACQNIMLGLPLNPTPPIHVHQICIYIISPRHRCRISRRISLLFISGRVRGMFGQCRGQSPWHVVAGRVMTLLAKHPAIKCRGTSAVARAVTRPVARPPGRLAAMLATAMSAARSRTHVAQRITTSPAASNTEVWRHRSRTHTRPDTR